MLTVTSALEVAARHQRQALVHAAAYAGARGEPVGFLRRAAPGGAIFEAVALESARTCADVDARGEVRLAAGERRPMPGNAAAPCFSTSVVRAGETALVASAQPADDQPA
jgi:hypothetical protein